MENARIRSFSGPCFSRIRTEYGEILRISPYSIRMRENADQKNSKYGQLSRSDKDILFRLTMSIRVLTIHIILKETFKRPHIVTIYYLIDLFENNSWFS